jgi:hypothetical protein
VAVITTLLLLGLPEVGLDDVFFDLGGHSPSEIATASGLLRACLPSTPIMRIRRPGRVRGPVGAAGHGGRSPSVIVRRA